MDSPQQLTLDLSKPLVRPPAPDDLQTKLNALDELFTQANVYRTSHAYMDLLRFIARFPEYAPYNVMLLHTQNPKVTKVATVKKWREDFGRRTKDGARPLVILRPFGPVQFVFDISDTEPIDPSYDPLKDWATPFAVDGNLKPFLWAHTRLSCASDKIALSHDRGLSARQAGYVQVITAAERAKLPERDKLCYYHITLNGDHSDAEQYATLAHELAHIFCGHLPHADPLAWWPRRPSLSQRQEELEAESVAYLVCRRAGLVTLSDRYLAGYADERDLTLPDISIDAVLTATQYIEEMGRPAFKTKRKEPKRAPNTAPK